MNIDDPLLLQLLTAVTAYRSTVASASFDARSFIVHLPPYDAHLPRDAQIIDLLCAGLGDAGYTSEIASSTYAASDAQTRYFASLGLLAPVEKHRRLILRWN